VIDTLKDVQHKGLVKVINKTELPGKPILLELLGYSSSNRIKTFYIEALNISARNLQTELVYVP
jgi:hypothetical protein